MTIRAVFFDMGGTIETYGWTPEMRIQQTAGIQKILAQAGIQLGLTDLQLYEIISEGMGKYHIKSLETMEELPSSRVWEEFVFSKFPVDHEKLSSIAEELMMFLEMHYFQRALRPEVPEVLFAIQKMGLKIGLISNVNSLGLVPACLEKYGLREYFDPVVLSSAYGRRKPDPAIFHYAARLAQVPTSASIYVGDRIARDILGADQAGFKAAVQIIHDYDHKELDEGAVPDVVIDNMQELLPFIEKLSSINNSVNARSCKPESEIQAVLFDAGDVLYFRPERGRYLRSFLRSAKINDKSPTNGDLIKLQKQAFQGEISRDEHHLAVLGLYGVNDPGQLKKGCKAMNADDDDIQFFDSVKETLITLKEKGYLLGIITDTANPLHVKLKWFREAGFGHVWDTIISSQDLGVQKPDPGIYLAALQQLDLRASQAVFVGHDIEELRGACGVGMKTIAFNYDPGANADYYIEKFHDLLAVPLLSEENTQVKV